MPVEIEEIVTVIHRPPQSAGQADSAPLRLTPEQVRQVAERVYALLLEDLRIEAERSRMAPKRGNGVKGGRF